MRINKQFSFLIFFFTFCLFGCNGQSVNEKDCVEAYSRALKAYGMYYSLQDESSLSESINFLNQAVTCNGTKLKAVRLKISVLILLKRFEAAALFVDSLEQNVLGLPYKKAMTQNYITALYLESKGDTAGRDSNFLKSLTVIQNFIDTAEKNHSTVNDEVYYDLLVIKMKVSGVAEVIKVIESLVAKFPNKKDYYEALKETFKNDDVYILPTVESTN